MQHLQSVRGDSTIRRPTQRCDQRVVREAHWKPERVEPTWLGFSGEPDWRKPVKMFASAQSLFCKRTTYSVNTTACRICGDNLSHGSAQRRVEDGSNQPTPDHRGGSTAVQQWGVERSSDRRAHTHDGEGERESRQVSEFPHHFGLVAQPGECRLIGVQTVGAERCIVTSCIIDIVQCRPTVSCRIVNRFRTILVQCR